jgi:anti-sigma factor RsiW
MDRTAATAHSGHDGLLIARLFGGDVTEPERDRALDLMAGCSECAAAFADFDVIEEAVVEMAVPVRPRDFTLTPQDAARLRSRRRLPAFAGWNGLRRALGSSMAALGLFGVVATSYLSSGAANGTFGSAQRDAAQPAAAAATAAAPNAGYAYATPAASGAPGTRGPVVASSDKHITSNSEDPSVRPVASSIPGSPGPEIALASPGSKSAGSCAQSSNTTCTSDLANGDGATPPAAPSSSGPDAGLLRLAGFGGLFLAGLAILLVPQLRRRRARGTRPR